jgi:crotonobetaine/carnitine-CoA ligase
MQFRSFSPSTINSTFAAAVKANPEGLFFDFYGDAYSYARMAFDIERLARGLHALGVKRGDRVVTLLDNGPDAVISWFATNRLGGIHVPINTAYKGEYLRHQIDDSGARIVICEREYVGDVGAVASGLKSLEHIFHRGSRVERGTWHGSISPLDEHRLDRGEMPDVEVAPSDLAAIIYTSGTTGLSKGCMASHNYLCDVSRRYGQTIGRMRDDMLWTPMPLFHITGIAVVLSTMQICATSAISRRFSVSNFWSDIERCQATMIVLLGSMALMVANAPDTPESVRCRGQVRSLIGIPMSRRLASIWRERFGVKWASGTVYGSTECGQALNAVFDEDVPDGCCGRMNDTFDVRIVNEHDEELPPNAVGEIVARPKRPNVMFSGYWNNPEATMKISRNLWHHMGDNGRVDEHGNFFFVDRSKDVIRRRGENISSFELELTFGQHPDIAEAAIHAVPSEVMEDDVKATVVLRPGASLKESELLDWARPRMPRFALPRYIEFREELPKNASGRVLKFQLREQGVTQPTWDCEKPKSS